jgi:hypothetical protein
MVNAEVEYYRQRASAGSTRHHQLTTYYQPPAFQRAATECEKQWVDTRVLCVLAGGTVATGITALTNRNIARRSQAAANCGQRGQAVGAIATGKTRLIT